MLGELEYQVEGALDPPEPPRHHGRLRRLLPLLLVLLAAARAAGSGLENPVVGTGWGHASLIDATALYWNPALLADLRRSQLIVTGGVALIDLRYQRERRGIYQREDEFDFKMPIDEASLDPDKTGISDEVSSLQPLIPATVFYALPLSDRWTLGFGLYGSFGAALKFPDDGPQRWSLQEARILGINTTAGAGVRVSDWLRLGATGSLVVGYLGLRQVVDLAGTTVIGDALANPPISQPNDFGADAAPPLRELEVLSRPVTIYDAFAVSGTFSFGAAFLPSPDWTIGLTYVHRVPLTFHGKFVLDMNNDFFTRDLAQQGLQYPPEVRGDAQVKLVFPLSVKAAVAFRPTGTVELAAGFQWFHYSEVKALKVHLESPSFEQPELGTPPTADVDLPQDWMDTFEIEVQGAWQALERLKLGLRFGYHTPFSPDETADVASPDGTRFVAGLLTDIRLNERFALMADYRHEWILERHVAASSHDLANGTYHFQVAVLTAGLRVDF